MLDFGNLLPLLIVALALFGFFKWVGRDMSGPSEKRKRGR